MKKLINASFTTLIIMVLAVLALTAPALYKAESSSDENSPDDFAQGNMPTPEREFGGPGARFFSAVEHLRYQIDYVYLNYIPFSTETVSRYGRLTDLINKPTSDLLDSMTAKKPDDQKRPALIEAITTTKKPVTDIITTTKGVTEPGTGTGTSSTQTVLTDSTGTDEPEIPVKDSRGAGYFIVPEGVTVSDFKTEYIKSAGEYRYYLTTLYLDNGEKAELYEKVCITPLTELEKKMEVQLTEINRLAASDTDVNFVVYIPTSFQASVNFDYYYYGYDENGFNGLLNKYLDGLDDSVSSGALVHYTLADRANLGYLTDHHWSSEGVFKGYSDIIGLFRIESTDVLPADNLPRKLIDVTPCKFYGSFAREIANDLRWDRFEVYDYELPEHETVYKKEYVYKVEDRIKLLEDADVKTLNSNAYGTFYPQITSVKYPGNKTGRNLLILGDSYTRSVAELVASSFDNTYIFYYTDCSYKNLEYNKFIEENGITDVLYMQYSERALFNNYGDAKLNRIITTDKGD